MKNKHSQNIPAEVLEQANQEVSKLLGLLAPYIIPLTPDQRHSMLKIGEKNLSFVEKASELAQMNPALCPSYLNMDDFEIDLVDTLGLRGLLNRIHQLSDAIDDTTMVAGSEAYNAALVFYSAVREAARQNVPGAKAVYEELKKRFPGRGKAREEEESTPDNNN